MKRNSILAAALITTIAAIATAMPARADGGPAYCTYRENGAKGRPIGMPCDFYQGQGHIVITWEDGVVSDFMPEKEAMTYRDQNGGMVYRTVGDSVNYFEMENGTIEVEFG
jgi:hypothetical protein